jgi:hypothetical protein
LLDGAAKKSADDVAQDGTGGGAPRFDGQLNIAEPCSFVAEMPFFLEDAEQSAHGGVTGGMGNGGADLGGGGFAGGVDGIHDLAFAAGELMDGGTHAGRGSVLMN